MIKKNMFLFGLFVNYQVRGQYFYLHKSRALFPKVFIGKSTLETEVQI
jgi:hypothetical protein